MSRYDDRRKAKTRTLTRKRERQLKGAALGMDYAGVHRSQGDLTLGAR